MSWIRHSVLVALLAALALVAAACGNDDDDVAATEIEAAPTEATPTDATPTEIAAFPVTVTHKYGEVTIESEPQRVVTVGFSDQDDLLALGVTPVGIRDWYGERPFAIWSWAQEALGDAEPEVIPAEELNFEAVAALEPDLIVGVSSGMTEEDYNTLSGIAPTVAQSGDFPDFGMPWQERTLLVGEAVGKPDEAAALVADIEARFAEARESHPEFEGVEAAVAFMFEGGPGGYGSNDVRARILEDLGFTTPTEFNELAGESFFFSLSPERIGVLDRGVVVWIAGDQSQLTEIAESPLRSGWTAFQEGREVFADEEVSGAFSFASPLSLDFLLDWIVPELAVAADGDPSTVVPSAEVVGSTSGAGEAASGASGEADAAMAAWAAVFDSSVVFEDKAPHLEDADALEASNEGYAAAGEAVGGISLAPSSAEVDGDTATVTYDVLFGEAAAYNDLTGEIALVDGTWVVGRDEYCGFLASARAPCTDQ